MKKRVWSLLLCGVMAVSLLAGCGSKEAPAETESEDGSDMEYVKSKGTLVVGITDFEPMDYKDENGEWIGFDADMAKAFAESLGVEAEFVEIDWDNKVLELDSKTIDCVWNGMTLSARNRDEMECTMAYLNNSQMIVVPFLSAGRRRAVEDCMHLLFAVEAGSAGEHELRDRNYRYTSTKTQMEALERVASGKADAAVVDGVMAGAMLGEGGQFSDLIMADILNSEEFGVGFRQGSDLAEEANAFLTECRQNGVIYDIAEKYGLQEMVIAPSGL